jgi:hypothetical protein
MIEAWCVSLLWGREVEAEEDREVVGNEGGQHGTTNPWQTVTDRKLDM